MTTTSTTTSEQLLAWDPAHGLTTTDPGSEGPFLAADSWLIRDGRVRALPRHRERFLRACAEAGGPPAAQLSAFWREMTAALPRADGTWFPRVELAAARTAGRRPQLRLRLRPAPPLAPAVRVWGAGQPDPRTLPRRKGPDLGTLAGVRRRASTQGQGADEAVLTTASGLILEAANSSILWWEDDTTLCLPAPELPVLPGVTTGLLQARARRSGIRLLHRRCTLDDLDGHEVWLVNALHGIRPVTDWTDRPITAGPAPRAAEWQAWLTGISEPLPGG
ncbi:aminotransferase class IV [Streptomyces sp. NBC_01537]|uniref:aminotransferase class IV n=1 Tax=Streptomyces sp. NBC_01537 TaxID=2903896 RepID=UPI00386B2248